MDYQTKAKIWIGAFSLCMVGWIGLFMYNNARGSVLWGEPTVETYVEKGPHHTGGGRGGVIILHHK